MTLVLRKCYKDGSSRNGFKYGQVGERVVCPDWDPKPKCGNGLHALKEGNGNWLLLEGDDWLIINTDDLVVDINEDKCKFNTGIILFRGIAKQLANSEFPHKLKLNEESAYEWALFIGNRDVMINKINTSKYAYLWARNIGNKDIMINKITESQWAYEWARYIGNKDIMINKITESYWAYSWALHIGNKDVMINKIDDSLDACYWAAYIGNQDVMKSKVTEKYWIERWNWTFPDDKIER